MKLTPKLNAINWKTFNWCGARIVQEIKGHRFNLSKGKDFKIKIQFAKLDDAAFKTDAEHLLNMLREKYNTMSETAMFASLNNSKASLNLIYTRPTKFTPHYKEDIILDEIIMDPPCGLEALAGTTAVLAKNYDLTLPWSCELNDNFDVISIIQSSLGPFDAGAYLLDGDGKRYPIVNKTYRLLKHLICYKSIPSLENVVDLAKLGDDVVGLVLGQLPRFDNIFQIVLDSLNDLIEATMEMWSYKQCHESRRIFAKSIKDAELKSLLFALFSGKVNSFHDTMKYVNTREVIKHIKKNNPTEAILLALRMTNLLEVEC